MGMNFLTYLLNLSHIAVGCKQR